MTKTKRPYRLITRETVAKHQAAELVAGNGSEAVMMLTPDYDGPKDRAYRIKKKSENMPTSQYIDDSLQQIGAEAIVELQGLVHSPNEHIRGQHVRYAIDHIRGKATQKSIALTGKLNIQSVLD